MESVKSSIGDAFLTLPLIIVGFTFFLGTLTSNISLLYLFLGHLTVVPALFTIYNTPLVSSSNIFGGAGILLSLLIIFAILFFSSFYVTGINVNFVWIALWIAMFLAVSAGLVRKDLPCGIGLNPLSWTSYFSQNKEQPSALCSIIPGLSDEKIPEKHTSPSAWVVNIAFFFGFIMANVISIYNQPTPQIPQSLTLDSPESLKDQQNKINARVNFRKILVSVIGTITTILFLILLYFRFNNGGCEKGFWYCLFPISICYLTGMAFFKVIYDNCGILPTDVLGIASGAISPDLIDAPIVCTGDTVQ
jgi:hypothetical protein